MQLVFVHSSIGTAGHRELLKLRARERKRRRKKKMNIFVDTDECNGTHWKMAAVDMPDWQVLPNNRRPRLVSPPLNRVWIKSVLLLNKRQECDDTMGQLSSACQMWTGGAVAAVAIELASTQCRSLFRQCMGWFDLVAGKRPPRVPPHLYRWPLYMDSSCTAIAMLERRKSMVRADWRLPIGIVPDMLLFVEVRRRMKPVK